MQERARAGGEEGAADVESDADGGSDDQGDEDALRSEVLRGKNMDVGSMSALKKRIEVRRRGSATVMAERSVCIALPGFASDAEQTRVCGRRSLEHVH